MLAVAAGVVGMGGMVELRLFHFEIVIRRAAVDFRLFCD